MKLSEAFPSLYLKAGEDVIEDEPLTVTVKTVEIVTMDGNGKSEKKLLVKFKELAKGLVCNKTNANILAELYGDDTDDWEGQRVILYATEVSFQGDMVAAIRVKKRKPAPAAKAGREQAPATARAGHESAAVRNAAGNPDAEDDDPDQVPY